MAKAFGSSKLIEDLIFKTVGKMESLSNNHEESAHIFLKLKEMLEQQEKIERDINENREVIQNLKNNIEENSSVIKNNIENLKMRITKLKK